MIYIGFGCTCIYPLVAEHFNHVWLKKAQFTSWWHDTEVYSAYDCVVGCRV